MIEQPTNQRELAAILRVLASAKLVTKSDLAEVEDRSVALARYLGSAAVPAFDVPEFVWHFLSDPDIRYKDSRYAEAQLAELESLLEQWEGTSPA